MSARLETNPRVIILVFFVLVSLLSIFINGIEFGIDFKGGTIFQIELEEKVSSDKMSTITAIIGERLDAFGLRDTKVNSLGDEFIAAQIAETDPEKIEQLETLLKTQGKFESILEGDVLFEGSDIIQIFKDPARGYGVVGQGNDGTGRPISYTWTLPFLLSQTAGEKFSKGIFHKCDAVSFGQQSGTVYDCKETYFFIDKPRDSVLIVPSKVFSDDTSLLIAGNSFENIPVGTSIDELILNSGSPSFVIANNGLSETQLAELSNLVNTNHNAIVHPSLSRDDEQALIGLGFIIKKVEPKDSIIPWIWTAIGARQVIGINANIANLNPFVENIENARIFSELVIEGSSPSQEEAHRELKALGVLLETGSLPIGIKSISKETISPLLGNEFLNSVLIIGLVGLAVVSIVIYIRYRILKLVLPIIITGMSEIILILGFASLVKFNLDLAAVAGILAAVGTGVDHQIIITDELLKGELVTTDTLLARAKKAFFIIFATAATTIATMLPIIFFSFGLGKLRGFAIIIIVGVLVGIFISRPAFSVLVQHVLKSEHKDD